MTVKTNKMFINNTFWLIFFFAFFKSVLFSHLGFGLLDEGESLHNATRILSGDLPYRDFFAIFPPLDNYFFALIFKIFDPSVIIPRVVMSFIFSFAPALMFLILSKYSNKLSSLFFPILLIFLDLNVERLYFFTPIFVAIYIYPKKPLLAGLWLGIASLVRFDIPGTFLIGLIAFSFINYISIKKDSRVLIRNVLQLCLGYLLPILFIVWWMEKNKNFNLFLESSFVRSVDITRLHHLPFPSILEIFPSNLGLSSLNNSFQAFYANLTILVYIIFFFLIIFTWKIIKKNLIILVFFISGALALPYVFGRSDMGHIVKGTMPVLFLAPYIYTRIKNFKLKLLIISIGTVTLLANLFQSIWWIRFNNSNVKIGNYNLNINSAYVSGSTAVTSSTLKKSVDFLTDTKADEKVLALPYMAGLYFLSNTMPPNNFNNLLAGFITTKAGEEKFINDIKASGVTKIVYARELGPKMKNNKLYEYNPLIDKYIMENYKIVEKTSDGLLLMIKNEK